MEREEKRPKRRTKKKITNLQAKWRRLKISRSKRPCLAVIIKKYDEKEERDRGREREGEKLIQFSNDK